MGQQRERANPERRRSADGVHVRPPDLHAASAGLQAHATGPLQTTAGHQQECLGRRQVRLYTASEFLVFYAPESPFMHLTVCCWFLISSGWGGGGGCGVGGGEARGPSWRGRIRQGRTGRLISLIHLSGPSRVIKFLYSPAPPPPTVWALDLPRILPNGTRLSARCHFTGSKKLENFRAQPPPTSPRNGYACIQNIMHGAVKSIDA